MLQRAANDTAGTLDGRLITITGFTLKAAGTVDLGRVVIICCAADAQLARIHLTGPASDMADGYPENTWIEVEGNSDAQATRCGRAVHSHPDRQSRQPN